MLNDTSWNAAVYSIQEELESIFGRGIGERSQPEFTLSATSRQYRSPQKSYDRWTPWDRPSLEMRHRRLPVGQH